MNIIVVGCGTVGAAICAQLAEEGHNITAVDSSAEALSEMLNSYDVINVEGSGADVSVLRRAGADRADLLLAVTSSDEINILCCAAAKKLGTKNTVARVRNPEYSELVQLMRGEMNLSLTINPELAAAKEIYRMLRFPSAAKTGTFCRGRVELAEIVVSEDSALCGLSLFELRSKLNIKFLVCGVLRGDEALIPSGDFCIQAGDVISITLPESDTARFFKEIGVYKQPTKNVLIVGGGRITYYLEAMLKDGKINSVVIEKDKKLCRDLIEQYSCTVICDDGTDHDLLLEEGIDRIDAFLALSDMDEENAIISMYAKKREVPKIITLIGKLSYVDLFKNMGLESIISPKSSIAEYILRYVRSMESVLDSEIESLHKIMDGNFEALEFIVKEDIPSLTDIPLKELKPRRGVLVACIVHNGNVIIPTGDDMIRRGDTVIIITSDKQMNSIRDIL